MCTFGSFSCIRKGTRRAGADTPHLLPPEGGTLLKKGKVLHRCTKRTPVRGGFPGKPCASIVQVLCRSDSTQSKQDA